MKRLIICLVIGLGVFLSFTDAAISQEEKQGRYVNSAAGKLGNWIDTSNTQGYKLKNDGFSVGGGWLQQNAQRWVPLYTMTLERNKTYRFIAIGDGDAKDVDIRIVNANGKEVAADTATSPEAVVDYTPNLTGTYTIQLRLFASKNNVPCMCFAVSMVK